MNGISDAWHISTKLAYIENVNYLLKPFTRQQNEPQQIENITGPYDPLHLQTLPMGTGAVLTLNKGHYVRQSDGLPQTGVSVIPVNQHNTAWVVATGIAMPTGTWVD